MDQLNSIKYQANSSFQDRTFHKEFNNKIAINKWEEFLNIDQISTYELLSPLLALCFGVPGAKKFKQQVNDLIRARDIATLESTYLNLIAA